MLEIHGTTKFLLLASLPLLRRVAGMNNLGAA
jgi:hypothetical protein